MLGKSRAEVDDGQALQLIDTALAGGLVRAEQDGVEAHREVLVDDLDGLLGICGRDEVALLLADLLAQLELGGADLPDRVVGHLERFEHDLLAHALGARLDHEDGVGGAGDHEVELRLVHAAHRRVHDDLAVQKAHAHGAHGTGPRHVRDHDRRRSAVDRKDRGVVLLVHGQHGRHHLDVEPEAVREQRAQRPVRQARGEDGGLAGPALAAHESAGDLACRVQLLFVVAGQREEVDAFPRLLRHHHRAEDDGVALANDHGSVRLLGRSAGLDRQPPSGDLDILCRYRHANTSMCGEDCREVR